MEVEVVVPKRLLDHEQAELLELAKMLDLAEAVGGVGIATEHDAGPTLADSRQNVDVPSWLNFDLDALITCGEFRLNLVEQVVDSVLYADRNAARDLSTRAAQKLPQRYGLGLSLCVPEGILQRSSRHSVTADGAETSLRSRSRVRTAGPRLTAPGKR